MLLLHQSVYVPVSEERVIVGRSKDGHTADGAEGPGAGAGSPAAADDGTAGKDCQHLWLQLQTDPKLPDGVVLLLNTIEQLTSLEHKLRRSSEDKQMLLKIELQYTNNITVGFC